MRCGIIANGNITNDEFTKRILRDCEYIICADGGARHLLKIDIVPHLIVGDLDSMDAYTKNYFMQKNVAFIKFPPKKDYTDTELAVEYALDKGANEITFMGVLGSRMDHSIANITLLLPLLYKGIKGKIVDEHNEMFIINKYEEVEGEIGEFLSIIPLSEKVEGITLEGLEYPLKDCTIHMGQTIGISNRFISKKAKITIGRGNALLIKARD